MAPGPASFWDSVRAWADAAGLLLPQDPEPEARPAVPRAVCDNCPICQGAATLDQVNPEVVNELAELARTMVLGLGSALGSAAEQRLSRPAPSSVAGEAQAPEEGSTGPGEQPDDADGDDESW